MTRSHVAWLLLLVSALGCGAEDDDGAQPNGGAGNEAGSGEAGSGGAGSGGEPSYSPCPDAERVGGFKVHAVAETMAMMPIAAHSELHGEVFDAVPPSSVWNELAARDECRLEVGPQLFCDPGCSSSETCGSSGCIASPRTQSVGDVAISGLAAAQSLSPSMSSRRYSLQAALPYPPFAEGAEILLEAAGGEYAPFALRTVGVPLLELDGADIVVERDRPVLLRWTARPEIGPARVFVVLDIAHHGGISARIECDAEDDGELDIPAELVTQLVDRGLAGFPAITVTRRSVDSAMIAPGCVDFEVGSQVVREVVVPGLASCSFERPCPDGQTCQADLTCA
jgi:hypothetical protein